MIGIETRRQILEAEGRLPDLVFGLCCVGGGSNAMGMFYPFIEDQTVRLMGVEAAGHGLDTEEHAASINKGSVGIFTWVEDTLCKMRMVKFYKPSRFLPV